MDGAAVLRWASPAATNKAMTVELGLVVVAAVLVVALLLIRARREHDLKIRKAASVGYFDHDAARYAHGSVTPGLTQEPADTADRPLAPTFVAPARAKTRKQGASAPPTPRPVPSAFGSFSSEPPGPVPAFDPVAAMGARPAATAGASAGVGPAASPPPPPPPPPAPSSALPGEAAPGPASMPPLEQPPPPGGRTERPGPGGR